MAADPNCGFDPEQPARRFHAILLDIDHSPKNLLHETNSAFYCVEGLRKLSAQLHPGGVFALWSDDPPDPEFMNALEETFEFPMAQVVKFANPLLGRDSESTVYVAIRP